ncbi:hypothetical protein B0H34DRAFT_706935 [Crassisporium funariophilum]|nr:hypothetical protein B0H34DRAFT_706935 [Crassisporium funariophilum]
MSDQPSPPPKPKPGSLRDRIAAFEKTSTTAGPAPGPAPAPRPKPAGFSTWKPKVPSPPSSPSASTTDHAAANSKAGAMSATDAKESITKGGSLKDRMAALQGKGAFGAPPALAPKPALEKPKWKPPPVVAAPVDDDDDHIAGAGEVSNAAAAERTMSPPVSVKSHASADAAKVLSEGEDSAPAAEPVAAATTEGDNDGEALGPEEEERQRRAAIAARMARLGGARLGMAPPVFGKKPPIKRPSVQEDDVPKADSSKEEDLPKRDVASPEARKSMDNKPVSSAADEGAISISSPPTDVPAQAQSDVGKSPEYFPVRKNSENASLLSMESSESHPSQSPPSMPVPKVPRRAGPPRKKVVKPAAPLEVPEEVAEDMTPPVQPTLTEKVEEIVEELEEEKPKQEHTELPELNEHDVPTSETKDEEPPKSDVEMSGRVSRKASLASVTEKEAITSPIQQESSTSPAATKSAIHEETSEAKEEVTHAQPPRSVSPELDEEESGSDYEQEAPIRPASPKSPTHGSYPKPYSRTILERKEDEAQVESEPPVPASMEQPEDDDAAEEELRRKQVKERLARMGGVNPFAPPPQRRPSEDSTHTSPPMPAASPPASIPLPAVAESPKQDLEKKAAPGSVVAPTNHGAPESRSLSDNLNTRKDLKVEEEDSDGDDGSVYDEEEDATPPANDKMHEKPKISSPSIPHEPSRIPSSPTSNRAPPISSPRSPVQVQQYGRGGDDDGNDGSFRQSPTHSRQPNPPNAHQQAPASIPLPFVAQKADASPARPAQPPRRIVPVAPEDNDDQDEGDEDEEVDEEADERMAASHLFVPPPQTRGVNVPPPARRGRYDHEEENDESADESTPLPVPHRRSVEVPPPAGRSVPLPSPHAPTSEHSEPDSDHDGQALPVRLRHPSEPSRLVIPPQAGAPSAHHPTRSLPRAPAKEVDRDETGSALSSARLTPSVSISESEEILDEEEGDPIDPSFHSPSRRGSTISFHTQPDTQALPVQVPTHSPQSSSHTSHTPAGQPEQPEQDAEQLKRKTIAERMAKLGGIKFGAAPGSGPIRPPQPPPRQEEEQQEGADDKAHAADEVLVELSEEDEERARKERISAKLAGMGGMRIGMMPMGMGSLPPQRSHALREESAASVPAQAPPTRAVPPSRPPPPSAQPTQQLHNQDTDSERGSVDASDDGVKVEAEESEIEEVNYEDAVEEKPPPVPSRGARAPYRRESSDKPTSPHLPVPSARPPIPTAKPTRRSSVQTSKSTGSASGGDFGYSPPQRRPSSHMPPSHSEYVMVEEPQGMEEMPPPPPSRTGRAPPARGTPRPPDMASDPSDSLSSQWELPSIPTSSLDFNTGGDLSLSWTDADEPSSPSVPSQAAGKQPSVSVPQKSAPVSPIERHLSADDLMAVWGRVGVQVCEVATSLFEKSKKTLIGDGTYSGFVSAVLAGVPNAAPLAPSSTHSNYGYLVYVQNGTAVQKRASDIMPGDIVEIFDGKLKGHKGIHMYHQNVGGAGGEVMVGIVGEFEAKKSKIRVFHANQHVGQQTVESVSYRLEDLKSGTVKVYRVLEA